MIYKNYNFMLGKPGRNCRSETLMRLLVTTSYPKASFSNLCLQMAKSTGVESELELENTAKELRDLEKNYTLLEFARSIEIYRGGNKLGLKLNILKFKPEMSDIIDNRENHTTLVDFNLNSVDGAVSNVRQLSSYILNLFYTTQRRYKNKLFSMDDVVWNSSFRDLSSGKITYDKITQEEAVELIEVSLNKKEFNILLLQNVLILTEQNRRLSFVE